MITTATYPRKRFMRISLSTISAKCGLAATITNITGNTDWREKFIKYAAALELAAGNPLYHWSHMELSMFFDIDKPLKSDNAAEIYDEANAFIAENLSLIHI